MTKLAFIAHSVASDKLNSGKIISSVTVDTNNMHGKPLVDLNSPLEVSENLKN